jgi:hypothetical protein
MYVCTTCMMRDLHKVEEGQQNHAGGWMNSLSSASASSLLDWMK